METNQNLSKEIVIKAKGLFLVFNAIFWGVVFAILLYASFTEGLKAEYIAIGGLVFLFSIIFRKRLSLTIGFDGITYQAFLKRYSLLWSDIKAVSTGFKSYGTSGEPLMTFHSGNSTKKDLKFNFLYFRNYDLHNLIQTILSKCSDVQLDKGTHEYLKRSHKSFQKRHTAG